MITDLINAMDDSAEPAAVLVPQITIDSAETSEETGEDDSELTHGTYLAGMLHCRFSPEFLYFHGFFPVK